ncbi:hypothetical protein acsn021_24160 [Anaerocolumna cellulosilytica]|uniref:Uncharacterized protein n=1 Tax=Anaerocolumna cellulosilytica TaxID=433286 RepID=A0A6S6R469_9FIRM|nr:hypothetical protein [Anaerocolumna cellulosilytica]MBB5193939.1 acyl carrier protein [Anaerocolumna cellulosilytica]BCJ94847.1 hypothetical protein acsn021_24160 [Anaerocolumna cellulosilytica]
MHNVEEVKRDILTMIREEKECYDINLEDELDLVSIQILNLVAKIEKKYLIEVDDSYIFHGLFSSACVISSYICNELELIKDDSWKSTCMD